MAKITVGAGPSSALAQPGEPGYIPEPPAEPERIAEPAAPKAARAVPSLSAPKAGITGSGGVTVPKAGAGGA